MSIISSRLVRAAVALAFLVAGPAASEPSDDLVGLWKAKAFGGEAVREIIVAKTGDRYVADVGGGRVPMNLVDGEIRFALPSGLGEFRGTVGSKGDIEGHWIISPRRAGGDQRYASPATLAQGPAGQWRGEVRLPPDALTFYLPVTRSENGALATYLRNPERNLGRFIAVERIERDGDRVRLLGRASPTGAETTLAEGVFHPDSDMISLNFEGFDTTFDFVRTGTDDEPGFYPRGKSPAPYSYAPPPVLDDGWPTGTLAEAKIDEEAVERFIDELAAVPMDGIGASQVHAVLIARHGKLVLEEYFHGFDRTTAHDTRSAAKSLTAVLIGAAMRAGAPFNVTTRLVDAIDPALFPEEIDPRLAATRVEHLLDMSAGFVCDDSDPSLPGHEDVMQEQAEELNWHRYALAVPMARQSGEKAVYCSMKPHLLGAVLSFETGRWLPELFRDLVAGPLDINRYHVNLTPTGDSYYGGGAYFEPRDFMKLGQLVLNEGTWKGRRILSRDYVRNMIATQTKIGERQYGWLWWITEYPYAEGTVRAVFAGGNGGQIVMAIPELDLVIAFYGGSYSDRALLIPQNVYVPERILPAVAR